MKIGFVTCPENMLASYFPTAAEPDFISPEPIFTPDDYLVVKDLRTHGHHVHGVTWGTPVSELLDFGLLIIRSPWDYANDPVKQQQFFDWLTELDANNLPVANSPVLMHWLLDKHYLRDFAASGIRIITTVYYDAGSQISLAEQFASQGKLILKPCIAAGGSGLFFIDSLDAAAQLQAACDDHMQRMDYMLQPYVPEIKTRGEWSVIFLGGQVSHAILKRPGKDSIFVHAERGGSLQFDVVAPPEIKQFASEVYAQICPGLLQATGISIPPDAILYMRIDILETANGPALIECEGVEPELFFRANLDSVTRFREAIDTINVVTND